MKRIGIDVDGVLTDFIGAFRLYLIGRTERAWSDYAAPQTWDFYAEWGLTKEQWEQHMHDFTYSPEFEAMRPQPGAVAGMRRLREMGHHLTIVTARGCDNRSSRRSQRLTCDWLAEFDVPYDDLVFTAEKEFLALDILLDDRVSHLFAAESSLITAVCFDAPYNRHWEGERVSDFAEFVRRVALGAYDAWEREPLA